VKSRTLTCITAITLFAALAIPVHLAAQHTRYKLIDIGTFGGSTSDLIEELRVINSRGTVTGFAETTTPDPYSPNCFLTDCFVAHAFEWQRGRLTDLGALPGVNNSGTNWISNSGLIAGGSENGAIDPILGIPEHHAVLWKNGQIIDLGTLGGGYQSTAWTANSRGQVAGDSLNLVPDPFNPAGTQERTFLWENGVMKDLGTLGGPDAGVIGFKGNVEMNERGQVVACSLTSSMPNPATGLPPVDPFLWENGKMLDLGSLGGTSGCAIYLNNRGQVVGYSNLEGDLATHPFLWDRGALTDLGTFGGSFGFANGINETGDAIGAATTQGDQELHAFRWRKGILTDLGTVPGDSCSSSFAVNAKGQVVGNSGDCSASFFDHAFLWEDGGPMLDLNTLVAPGSGIQLVWAKDIDDRGQIAGLGILPNGDTHVIVLIPCQEGDKCEDHAVSKPAITRNNPPLASKLATSPQLRLTPSEMIAAWRARLAHQYHIPGLGAPRD
jgi:probable HAF family extracellular repeat protein